MSEFSLSVADCYLSIDSGLFDEIQNRRDSPIRYFFFNFGQKTIHSKNLFKNGTLVKNEKCFLVILRSPRSPKKSLNLRMTTFSEKNDQGILIRIAIELQLIDWCHLL